MRVYSICLKENRVYGYEPLIKLKTGRIKRDML